jgi:hypothetical protein
MNIGVFGDSYAEKQSPIDAWWQRLIHDHGHNVTSYGEAGSSISFSANLLAQFHNQHDFNIWCLTIPGRISAPLGDGSFFHSTKHMDGQGNLKEVPVGFGTANKQSVNIHFTLIDTSHKYLKYIFDWDYEVLVGKLLVDHYLKIIPNLMIIPCFGPPLDTEENLFKVCELEIQSVLPGKQVPEVYQEYWDKRSCHLTTTNNKILSNIVNQNLSPGILKIQHSDFYFDNIKINDILRKKS